MEMRLFGQSFLLQKFIVYGQASAFMEIGIAYPSFDVKKKNRKKCRLRSSGRFAGRTVPHGRPDQSAS